MTQNPQPPEDPNAGRPALVLDTPHLSVALQALGELTVRVDDGAKTSEALRLTRLTLHDANGDRIDELDGLLAEVRRRIAAERGGWVPPLGKDREASSSVSMMRGGNPKPTGLSPVIPEAADLVSSAVEPKPAAGIRIGVVDTTLYPWNEPPAEVRAWQGHAAFVADIVDATASGVDLTPRAALTEKDGKGTGWAVASAITELTAGAEDPVDILLLPLACFTADGQPPLLMERAIAAVPETTLIIAAAGNQTLDPGWSALGRGPRNPAWPAALPRVKAVGVDQAELSRLTGHLIVPTPPWVDAVTAKVDFVGDFFDTDVVVAEEKQDEGLGVETVRFRGKAKWRGTSFSAAYAAGLVAAKMTASGLSAVDAWDALLDDAEDTSLQRPEPDPGQP